MLSSLFRRRDASIYPADEFGNELYRVFPNPKEIPFQAMIWFDIYFEKQPDADRMATYLENRRADINRDHDEEPDEEFGQWNVDAEFPINPTYREIRAAVTQMRDKAVSSHGKLATWMLSRVE